jgi:hypothetical protein
MAYSRPAVVAIGGALTWAAGAVDVVIGVALIVAAGVNAVVLQFGGAAQLFTNAIGSLGFGAILFFAGAGVLSGKSVARIVATGALAISILGAILPALLVPTAFFGSWIGVAISIVAIVLLWMPAANVYFREDAENRDH